MRHGQQDGARDFARNTLSAGKIRRRVGAARPSVAERYRSGYLVSDNDWEHEDRSARETPVQVGDAAARRGLTVILNASTQRWPPGANNLRDRASKVVTANAVDPLERAEKTVARGRDMRGGDADDRAARH